MRMVASRIFCERLSVRIEESGVLVLEVEADSRWISEWLSGRVHKGWILVLEIEVSRLLVPVIFRVFFFAEGAELFFQQLDLFLLGLHQSLSQVFDHVTELVMLVVGSCVVTFGLELLDNFAALHAFSAHDEAAVLVAC